MALTYYKHKNGTTYVYESVSYWDKEKQQSRSKRTCVGKLDDVTGGDALLEPAGTLGGSAVVEGIRDTVAVSLLLEVVVADLGRDGQAWVYFLVRIHALGHTFNASGSFALASGTVANWP